MCYSGGDPSVVTFSHRSKLRRHTNTTNTLTSPLLYMGPRGPILRRSMDPISALTGYHAPVRGAGRTAHAPGSPTPPLGPLGPQERARHPLRPRPAAPLRTESSAARRRRRASRAAALAPFLTRALHQSACLWHRRSSDRWRGRCSAPPSVARAAQSLLRPSVRRAHRVRPRCRRRHCHPLLAVFPTPTLPPWPSSTHTYNDSEASV